MEELSRTPPGVRELKLGYLEGLEVVHRGRTPPGVRELKRLKIDLVWGE